MLLEYIQAALCRAKYEILPDDGSYYGEIRECNCVYANAKTLDECREELREVLEEWVLFRVHKNLRLPTIDGIELLIKDVHCASLNTCRSILRRKDVPPHTPVSPRYMSGFDT